MGHQKSNVELTAYTSLYSRAMAPGDYLSYTGLFWIYQIIKLTCIIKVLGMEIILYFVVLSILCPFPHVEQG